MRDGRVHLICSIRVGLGPGGRVAYSDTAAAAAADAQTSAVRRSCRFFIMLRFIIPYVRVQMRWARARARMRFGCGRRNGLIYGGRTHVRASKYKVTIIACTHV